MALPRTVVATDSEGLLTVTAAEMLLQLMELIDLQIRELLMLLQLMELTDLEMRDLLMLFSSDRSKGSFSRSSFLSSFLLAENETKCGNLNI